MFKEFIIAEDNLNQYNNFWIVWDLFKEKVIELGKHGDSYWYTEKIIRSFLFAEVPWNEAATEWHTLKEKDKRFLKDISYKLGHCPSTLYSISKLLNDIGSSFLEDGILWISYILKNNSNLVNIKLEVNTIFYIEIIVRNYAFKNREIIKRTKEVKDSILVILNFLIMKGSVTGYMLREYLF